ncbi:uncharacterized protein FMAN_05090 [Fusarium mangiferae]|uniref:Uncharacterized protein n=1 Tax=Fusarium mangiferae TaxID=192010 RepID=A0A1L7SWA3_FUSMA|nr:uncharacterized protein FMAN_05090 [Fusarium mangiferae]CVK88183.1 uncharacterized protein FMAN_05090 [Fusarium mangiferae]
MAGWPWTLAAAETIDGQSQQDLEQATSRGVEEDTKTMIECGKHISSCGVVDDMKIVLRPKTTVYVTQNVTTTVSTFLPPETNVITEVVATTVKKDVLGHCRNTTTIDIEKPATVTVNVEVEYIKEVVSIVNVTSTTTSTVMVNSIEQCFINSLRGVSRLPDEELYTTTAVEARQQHSSSSIAVEDEREEERPTETGQVRHEHHYEQVAEDVSHDNARFMFQERDAL